MAKRKGVSDPKQKTVNGRTYWHCRVTIGRRPDGTLDRKDVYAPTYEECTRKRNAIMAEVDQGTFVDPARMTVSAWFAQWMAEFMADLKDTTRTEYQGIIDRHIRPGLGARQLPKLTMMDCQRFVNSLSLSPGTVRNAYSILHKRLETARRAQLIAYNPADDLTLPKLQEKERHALTPEEADRFLQAIKGDPTENMFVFMLETGMRIGEARGLRWTSVNFKQGEVRIVEQLNQSRGRDGKEVFSAPKRDSKRTIYPTQTAMTALQLERVAQRERRKAAGNLWTDEFGLVFTQGDGSPIPYRTIAARLTRIGKQIGVEGLSAHCLRHTYATDCNDAGVSAKTVAAALGHKRTSITTDRYTHDTKDAQRAASEKLQAQKTKRGS